MDGPKSRRSTSPPSTVRPNDVSTRRNRSTPAPWAPVCDQRPERRLFETASDGLPLEGPPHDPREPSCNLVAADGSGMQPAGVHRPHVRPRLLVVSSVRLVRRVERQERAVGVGAGEVDLRLSPGVSAEREEASFGRLVGPYVRQADGRVPEACLARHVRGQAGPVRLQLPFLRSAATYFSSLFCSAEIHRFAFA